MEKDIVTPEDIIKALDKLKDLEKPLIEQKWKDWEYYKKHKNNLLPEGKNIIYGKD